MQNRCELLIPMVHVPLPLPPHQMLLAKLLLCTQRHINKTIPVDYTTTNQTTSRMALLNTFKIHTYST